MMYIQILGHAHVTYDINLLSIVCSEGSILPLVTQHEQFQILGWFYLHSGGLQHTQT